MIIIISLRQLSYNSYIDIPNIVIRSEDSEPVDDGDIIIDDDEVLMIETTVMQ